MAALIANDTALSALKVCLIDSGADSVGPLADEFEPRVVAISERSKGIFQQANMWPELKGLRHCAYRSMHVWDAEGTGKVGFDADAIGLDQLGYIFENKAILSAIESNLSGSSIEQIRGCEVERIQSRGQVSSLVLNTGEILEAGLVVAADGAHSSLRALLNIPTREWDYKQTAIVCSVETEFSHEFCAWQRFTESGPLAFLPLSKHGEDSQHCSIVWSLDNDEAEKTLALNDQAFCLALARNFEHRLGKVLSSSKRFSFPLRQRHSANYFEQGVVLVGDAAHTIHPLAGQGVNLGLYDIDVLGSEIVRAVQRGYALSELPLKRRYERQRQAHNLMAMAAMEGFKRLFGSSNIALRYLRNAGLNIVDAQGILKRQFSLLAAGSERESGR